MKIELKSIKFSEALSEETNAFTADVWINGKKAGYAKNDGHGGCTMVNPYINYRELFAEAENWAKEQPKINIGSEEKPYLVSSNMESLIDSLFENWLKKKGEKALERRCKKGLCYGEKTHYRYIAWKNRTIEDLLNNPTTRQILKGKVVELLNKGENILNKNLPEDWLTANVDA